jgi:hypothetical protein
LTDHLADYLALREANNRLRQDGIETIWNSLESILTRHNEDISGQAGRHPLQIGRQEWQFTLDQSTLIGERLGLRLNFRTIVFEIGWPRLPEHGYVPGGGLARGRVGFSQNTMLDPQPVAGIVLRRDPSGLSARWFLIAPDHQTGSLAGIGEELTPARIGQFVNLLAD